MRVLTRERCARARALLCMNVCMYICMHVSTYVWIRVYGTVCVFVMSVIYITGNSKERRVSLIEHVPGRYCDVAMLSIHYKSFASYAHFQCPYKV